MKKALALLLALVMILSLCACGEKSPADEWPTTGLGAMLPAPDSKNIRIWYELDDTFSADIEKAKEEDFISYVTKCEAAGFTVDADSGLNDYTAYNSDGYRVTLYFSEGLESVSIILDAPKVNGTMNWPTIGLATLLPVPNTNVGTISIDSSTQFDAYVGETSFEDYQTYVDLCIDKGFHVDHSKDEKVYRADNTDGVSLRLEYQGFDTMYISMYAPDDGEEDTAASAETTEQSTQPTDQPAETTEQPAEPTEQPAEATEQPTEPTEQPEASVTPDPAESSENTDLVDGMRPEFKAAIDSYEDFFEEYCAFMKKYADNPTDLGLLADYADYMAQYAETMSKLEALDDGEMNDAETKYYIEVSGRITQMLLETSDTIG